MAADGEEGQVEALSRVDSFTPFSPQTPLCHIVTAPPPTLIFQTRKNTQTNSWSFKSRANMTVDPEAPAAIAAGGVLVKLVTVSGTVLDQIAYTASNCRAKMTKGSLRRIDCRIKGQKGKLTFVRVAKTNAIFTVNGAFSMRNIDGTTAANEAPLGVVMAAGADGSGSSFEGQYVVLGLARSPLCVLGCVCVCVR
jgi:hypothetical protein